MEATAGVVEVVVEAEAFTAGVVMALEVEAFKAPAATASLEVVAEPGGATQVGTGGVIPTITPTRFLTRPSLPCTTHGNKQREHRAHHPNSSIL